jgi:hypothetical protein
MTGIFRQENDLEGISTEDSLFTLSTVQNLNGFTLERNNLVDNTTIGRLDEVGVYCMIDSRRAAIIRVGKTNDGFGNRLETHKKASNLTSGAAKASRLYMSYPNDSIDSNAIGFGAKGRWSDIKSSGIVRWKKECKQSVRAVLSLFEWDDFTLKGLELNKTIGTIEEKKEQMVAYLFETVASLGLKPNDNISSNPSFESFNGRFGG